MQNNKKFLWGVVNIGQQTEGPRSINAREGVASKVDSNWNRWAKRGLVPEIGVANNYWRDYKKDHDLVEKIGCNSMRITVEWSRIEPTEGVLDQQAISHYRKIILDLQRRNISVVVGLWHWSVPMWFEEKYGMHHRKCPTLFARFVKFVRDELGDVIDYVVVFNEPLVYILTSYLNGSRPPFYKNYYRSWLVLRNLKKMHKETFLLWKEKFSDTPVGSAYLWNYDVGRDDSLFQRSFLYWRSFFQNVYLLKSLQKYSDYIGINYYTSDSFFFGKKDDEFGFHNTNDWHSPTVWEHFPQGLYKVLLEAVNLKKPILILENGKPSVPGVEDADRQEFLQKSIYYVKKAIAEGVDVQGYFHYSLCDSYEWTSGYDFKFGLVEIDRSTGKRISRKSCAIYREIIKSSKSV